MKISYTKTVRCILTQKKALGETVRDRKLTTLLVTTSFLNAYTATVIHNIIHRKRLTTRLKNKDITEGENKKENIEINS